MGKGEKNMKKGVTGILSLLAGAVVGAGVAGRKVGEKRKRFRRCQINIYHYIL